MSTTLPDVVERYFKLDAVRDIESIVALFTKDATVIDEGETWHGTTAIRAWQNGPASKYTYTTEVINSETVMPNHRLVRARLTGSFPGGTAELTFDFTLANQRITRLAIAP